MKEKLLTAIFTAVSTAALAMFSACGDAHSTSATEESSSATTNSYAANSSDSEDSSSSTVTSSSTNDSSSSVIESSGNVTDSNDSEDSSSSAVTSSSTNDSSSSIIESSSSSNVLSSSSDMSSSSSEFADVWEYLESLPCNMEHRCEQVTYEDLLWECTGAEWYPVVDGIYESCAGSSSSATSSQNEPGIYDANENTLTDTRDDRVYKTTVIGNQVWMAENLAYWEDPDNMFAVQACYERNPDNCETDGHLYYQDVASTICPGGWHLPKKSDFKILTEANNWQEFFNIKFVGFGGDMGSYSGKESFAGFWSADTVITDNKDTFLKYQAFALQVTSETYSIEQQPQGMRYSVRCLKD